MRLTFCILLSAVSSCLAGPVYPTDEQPQAQKLYITDDMKVAMVKDLQKEVLRAAMLRTVADTLKLEQAAEEKIFEAAVETLEEEPSPERTEKLKEVEKLLKREKRAVQLLNGLLGGSSGGGGGGGAEASAGSDSGAILNLIGPLLGSSSGGAGGGGENGENGGGSDLSSILGISGPLLGSSSGGGAGGEGGATASAGSDSGSILNLITPLLGSSSGGSSGGGDASGGGGLGNILSISSSSSGSGGAGGAAVDTGNNNNSILGNIKGAKFALISDKVQLVMRVIFSIVSKLLTVTTNKIAQASIPPVEHSNIDNLRYPS